MDRKLAAKLMFAVMWASALVGGVFCVMKTIFYRFQHPDLSETRLFMELWGYIVGACVLLLAAGHWWNNRPGGTR